MPKLRSSYASKSVEDCLKAVWLNSPDGPVATGTVAVSLGISDASVSDMLGKLDDQELVRYTRYHGAQLTASGERVALQLLRRPSSHRSLPDRVSRLRRERSSLQGRGARARYFRPFHQTAGSASRPLYPRPPQRSHSEGRWALPDTPDTPLTEAALYRSFLASRPKTQDADILSYFTELGIYPGQRVEVQCRDPVGRLVKVAVGGDPPVLANELAVLIRGEVVV